MGIKLITENMIFNPSFHGISVGQLFYCICIGGGGAGGGGNNIVGGNAGEGPKYANGSLVGSYRCGAGGGGFGAGGGGGEGINDSVHAGGGGSSGEMKVKILTLNNSDTIPVTIGAGGLGRLNTAGTNGGSTSFGTYLTANGGIAGGIGYGGNVSWAMGNGGGVNTAYRSQAGGGGGGGYILGQRKFGGDGGDGGYATLSKGNYIVYRYAGPGNNYSGTGGNSYQEGDVVHPKKASTYSGNYGGNGRGFPKDEYRGQGAVVIIW